MVSGRLLCPVCGRSLAASSISAHLGRRACMERKFPHLKAQRLESARRAKLEYDRLHATARRDALRELAMQLIEAPQAASAIEEPLEEARLPSFGLGQLGPQVPDVGEEAAVSLDVIHPPTNLPMVIDMTEAEGEEPQDICPICQEVLADADHFTRGDPNLPGEPHGT
ncbi:hypothetical protein JG687_00007211 [Phytophthora cactorum]|uniref:Uncharacterized protein n=1 Tax=Phytophthora cactorum TaxID=29920 RepID=A0A329SCT5_9STRA|nr:hypothetical protein PC111_g13377 [Phytophthora cactorum]KAG2853819.1 hypothetical protein PC113_g13846 [Phytophthora cactorum]KAG2981880.1 hypothetical protein PC118_g10326 [Phytophthora cactorum]KAG3008233.1 hypothetical protein PC119_g14317 [Phytophthora cactorum]KAG3013372.1 hypothetical protein PC120_g13320 [Phytophthora cactorum]